MPQTPTIVQSLLLRELETLKREVATYPDDAAVWALAPGITNSAGTLALHCAGNIQHFIGSRLGGTGYTRNRDAEFARRDVPRAEILAELDRAIAAVASLSRMATAEIPAVFPDSFGGKQVNTDVMLVHLAVHLGYHLGQVDYHRRITTGRSDTVDAVSAAALPPPL